MKKEIHLQGNIRKETIQKENSHKNNIHTSRECWLRAATDELRPDFAKLGFTLPEKIRFAIAFPSGGKRGPEAECLHPASSADQHFEIYIRPDIDDPVEVLGKLVPQLIHTLLPIEAKHGKSFRDIALRIGLEGQMRHTVPTPALAERLQAIVANLGPLPHAKVDLAMRSKIRKKQGVRMLKAECSAACGYTIRLIPKWAKVGMPVCPVNAEHGPLICDMPETHGGNIAPELVAE
jgi:hypothetical protein